MKILWTMLMTVSIGLLCVLNLHSQVFLQLEEAKEVKAHKFYEGDIVMIKTDKFPKLWQRHKLERFLVEEQVLVTSEGLLELKEITHIKLYNSTLAYLGKGFMTFGSGWFLFGGLGSLYEMRLIMTGAQIGLGGAALVVGYLFWRYASRRTVKLGKNNRLRLLDISFPSSPVMRMP